MTMNIILLLVKLRIVLVYLGKIVFSESPVHHTVDEEKMSILPKNGEGGGVIFEYKKCLFLRRLLTTWDVSYAQNAWK